MKETNIITDIFYRRYCGRDFTIGVEAIHNHHPDIVEKYVYYNGDECTLGWDFLDSPGFKERKYKIFQRWWLGVKEEYRAWKENGYYQRSKITGYIPPNHTFSITLLYHSHQYNNSFEIPNRWLEIVFKDSEGLERTLCTNDFSISKLYELLTRDPFLSSSLVRKSKVTLKWFAEVWITYLSYRKKIHKNPLRIPRLRRILL